MSEPLHPIDVERGWAWALAQVDAATTPQTLAQHVATGTVLAQLARLHVQQGVESELPNGERVRVHGDRDRLVLQRLPPLPQTALGPVGRALRWLLAPLRWALQRRPTAPTSTPSRGLVPLDRRANRGPA